VNKVASEATLYRSALNQFKDQYGYLPGDFPTATQVWGRADGGTDLFSNCAAPISDVSVGKPTCNGDGNGVWANGTENYRAWQQLAAAEYIPGSFTGVRGSGGGNDSIAGQNAPAAGMPNTSFFFYNWGLVSGGHYAGDYTNAMVFGKEVTNSWPYRGALQPKEAYNMDSKYDDGLPAQGSMRQFTATWNASSGNTPCSSDDTITATYVRSNTGTGCPMIFRQDFKASPSAQ